MTPLHLSEVLRYLRHHSDEFVRDSTFSFDVLAKPWAKAVVIPTYAESELIKECLSTVQEAAKSYAKSNEIGLACVAIIVVNHREDDSGSLVESDNLQTLKKLDESGEKIFGKIDDTVFIRRSSQHLDVCVLNFTLKNKYRFGKKDGVGRARKIGCDFACKALISGNLRSPWIHTTDADVRVADDYFGDPANGEDLCVAEIALFKHAPMDPNALSWRALELYEKWLYYYEHGLQIAGSPYAMQTIGSTISVNAHAYALVRGFPDRLAGEDFYILNKLVKVGRVVSSRRSPITILDRESSRVPFGTGVSVKKITADLMADKPFHVTAPECFKVLGIFLENVPGLYTQVLGAETNPQKICDALALLYPKAALVFPKIWSELGIGGQLESIAKRSTREDVFIKNFHQWFDALKTLRFLHLMRDYAYPDVPADFRL